MIIHCLSCGKAVSSKNCACPYCRAEVTEITKELSGLVEKEDLRERLRGTIFGFVLK